MVLFIAKDRPASDLACVGHTRQPTVFVLCKCLAQVINLREKTYTQFARMERGKRRVQKQQMTGRRIEEGTRWIWKRTMFEKLGQHCPVTMTLRIRERSLAEVFEGYCNCVHNIMQLFTSQYRDLILDCSLRSFPWGAKIRVFCISKIGNWKI